MYCIRCKRKTDTVDITHRLSRNRRPYKRGKCTNCGLTKTQFVKLDSKIGKGLLNTLINKLPVEMHIPGYQYCGPGTKLKKRLQRGDPGINALDKACKQHDIAYAQEPSLNARHKADRQLSIAAAETLADPDATIGNKFAARAVKTVMDAKVKLGMGSKRKH